jgi:hypothetical protein
MIGDMPALDAVVAGVWGRLVARPLFFTPECMVRAGGFPPTLLELDERARSLK